MLTTTLKIFLSLVQKERGFPGVSDGKETACNTGDLDLIPGLGRSPEEGSGYPPQSSCLESSMDRGVWRTTVHGVAESDPLSDFHFHRKKGIEFLRD